LAVLALGAVTLTCGRAGEPAGVVRLALLVPPAGPAVNEGQWEILGTSSTPVRSGTIETSDVNATPTVVTSCPAGNFYVVVLSATATDGTKCSGSSSPFNVIAGATVEAAVQLVCGGSHQGTGSGSVIVNATVTAGDNCPVLTSWEVAPQKTSSGG